MEDITLSGFGDILKAYRKQRKISQQELASRLDVHRNTIGGWERGDFLPESKTIVLELAKQLRLNDNETRRLLEASLTAITPYWNVPYQRNPFFTGREELLHTLHEQLRTKQAVALCQSYALSGLGGIGKTQVAVEYTYRYHSEYAAIIWIEAETYETMLSSFVSVATLLNLVEKQEKDQNQIVTSVIRWLNNHNNWLLIFDNVEEAALLKRFLPTPRQGSILLTSRMRTPGMAAESLEVSQMSLEVGIRFLLQRAKMINIHTSEEQVSSAEYTTARTIVEELDGLPLALDQAGAYIDETQCSLADFLSLFQTYPISLLKERDMYVDHPLSVERTFSFAFEKIRHANSSALDLLTLCAFLAPVAIPEEIITKGASVCYPIFTDPLQFHNALKQILAYSLIRRNIQEKTLLIHRLVQSVLKGHLDKRQQVLWAERTAQIVNAVFPTVEFSTWQLCERLLPHALVSLEQLKHLTENEQEQHLAIDVISLLIKTADYLTVRARYNEAEPLFQRAMFIQERVPDPDQLGKADLLNRFASFYGEQGKYEQAELYALQSLHIREQALGSKHLDVASSLFRLAEIYRRQGKHDQAELYFHQSLHIREQILGFEHLDVAKSLQGLASIYGEQGKCEQAEAHFLRALHIQEHILGSEHPDLLVTLLNLSTVYAIQEKYEQAEPLFYRTLHIQESTLGLEHPQTAYSLNNLAELYRRQGKYEQAESLFQQTLHIREKAFGSEHPLVAHPLNGLADIYRDQGRYKQAEPLLQRTLQIREHALAHDHPDIAMSLTSLAELYKAQGMFEQAESYFQRALHMGTTFYARAS